MDQLLRAVAYQHAIRRMKRNRDGIPRPDKSTEGLVRVAAFRLKPAPVRQPSRPGYIPAWDRRRCRNARSVGGAGCCAGRVMPVARANEACPRHRLTATTSGNGLLRYLYRYPSPLECQSQFPRTPKFRGEFSQSEKCVTSFCAFWVLVASFAHSHGMVRRPTVAWVCYLCRLSPLAAMPPFSG